MLGRGGGGAPPMIARDDGSPATPDRRGGCNRPAELGVVMGVTSHHSGGPRMRRSRLGPMLGGALLAAFLVPTTALAAGASPRATTADAPAARHAHDPAAAACSRRRCWPATRPGDRLPLVGARRASTSARTACGGSWTPGRASSSPPCARPTSRSASSTADIRARAHVHLSGRGDRHRRARRRDQQPGQGRGRAAGREARASTAPS